MSMRTGENYPWPRPEFLGTFASCGGSLADFLARSGGEDLEFGEIRILVLYELDAGIVGTFPILEDGRAVLGDVADHLGMERHGDFLLPALGAIAPEPAVDGSDHALL